jgi:HD-GYP domain-containing protein (c-di-GMP phosphodiesterase class II)
LDIPEHTRPGTPERSGVRLAEVMAALSLATDLGMGQPMEQGLGVCLLAVRFGEKLGLDDDALGRLYDIALLRHIGCTAETVGFAAVMGDELAARRRGGSFVDWGRPPEAIGYVVGHVARTNPPLRAARMLVRLPVVASRMKAGAVAVCEVAELLAQRFAIDTVAHGELVAVYERWDGRGFPGRLRGEAIPPVARIVQLAEAARMFAADQGPDAALAVLRRRAGGAYDPELVERFCRVGGPLLDSLAEEESLWDATLAAEPSARPPLDGTALDSALRAIGEFADLKSPSTVGHSSGVAELAAEAGAAFGCSEPERTELRRAGWVHDVGRVGVSSLVWEKPGPLSHGEREQVRLHPYYTERVLSRPPFLAALAPVATAHHERLDGSGYHRGVRAGSLTPAARLLAAADAYQAMTEPRPHREAFPRERAAEVISEEARAGRLDADAVGAVLEAAGQQAPLIERPAGLTEREVEVVALLARGRQTKEVAHALGISVKTADRHIQNAYRKIGVSTRAAAAVFAMEHGLTAWGELPIGSGAGRS